MVNGKQLVLLFVNEKCRFNTRRETAVSYNAVGVLADCKYAGNPKQLKTCAHVSESKTILQNSRK
jgi:transcriptional regulator with GAF, ATPase, and Fis domain